MFSRAFRGLGERLGDGLRWGRHSCAELGRVVLAGFLVCVAVTATASAQAKPTISTLTVKGADPYSLSCQVLGAAVPAVPGPTGTVTFSDITANQTLATASLGTATQGPGFLPESLGIPEGGSGAVGDFNGDGILDLAVFYGIGATIDILLGNGDGTFQPPIVTSLAAGVGGVLVAGDFNGDGKLDLAFAGTGNIREGVPSAVWVLYGNGNGTFQPAQLTNLSNYVLSGVATGDFNGDGIADLAMSDNIEDEVVILLGQSGGGFQTPVTYAEAHLPSTIVTGDFNDDKKTDLAVMNNRGIAVLLGNGDGTFQPLNIDNLGFAPTALQAADFNGDGKTDLAVSYNGVWILLSNGDGTFQYQPSPTIASGAASVVGDFNNDEIPDLIVNGTYPNFLVYLGIGDGTFEESAFNGTEFLPQNNASSYFAANLIADGATDLTNAYVALLDVTEAWASGISANVTVDAGTVTTHDLECSYSGDSNYAASTSAPHTVSFGPAATPVFSLLIGNYASAQTVSISDATENATIYYTSNGNTPTRYSTPYTGPITVSSTVTLKAIAAGISSTPSPVSEAVYTITDPPAFSVPGGNYATQQMVSLSDSTSGAVIYYTTDGSTPGKASTQYTTPITVASTETLNAVALAPGSLYSAVTTETYTFPPATTSTALQASATTGDINQQITLTATVTGTNPTGSVTFSAGGSSLGEATLSSGVATLKTSFASAGTYSVTAAYSGDAGNLASTSGAVSITIIAASFTIGASPASQTVNAGQSAAYALTVTPAGGYAGTMNFSCGTLPAKTNCAFSASSVTITGSTAASTTLTISTTASTTSGNTAPANPFAPWTAGGGAALAGILGLAFAPRKSRRWNRRFRVLACTALLAALWLPLGCGGGGNSGGGSTIPGTPAGTYSVSVTAKDSTAGLSNTVQLTLVVQ